MLPDELIANAQLEAPPSVPRSIIAPSWYMNAWIAPSLVCDAPTMRPPFSAEARVWLPPSVPMSTGSRYVGANGAVCADATEAFPRTVTAVTAVIQVANSGCSMRHLRKARLTVEQ